MSKIRIAKMNKEDKIGVHEVKGLTSITIVFRILYADSFRMSLTLRKDDRSSD